MKKWWFAAGAFVLILVGCLLFAFMKPAATLRLGGAVFTMHVARTDSELTQGLSGTSELHDDVALLFDFGSTDRRGIWMKDMNYPIDILWLNEQKQVNYIVKDAQPDSYPDTTFRPKQPARYVIELKAGTVEAKRITIGTQAMFDSTKGSFK